MNIILCNQFKNEALRLKEWLLYNKEIGVSNFILINDHSTDDSIDIIKSIKDITVHIINAKTPQTTFNNSRDTNSYQGDLTLAANLITHYRYAHNFCLNTYGRDTYLGFFDVDEFIFYPEYPNKNLLDIIENKFNNKPVLAIGSLEVDSNLFDVNVGYITKQTTRAMSFENKSKGTRYTTVKSFQNLQYNDLTIFYKEPAHEYGHHIHHGGVRPDDASFMPLNECAFLHYRSPIYDPHINRPLCNIDYDKVKQISIKAEHQNGKTI